MKSLSHHKYTNTKTTMVVPLGNKIKVKSKTVKLIDNFSIKIMDPEKFDPLFKTLRPSLNISDLQYFFFGNTFLFFSFEAPKIEEKHVDDTGIRKDDEIWQLFDNCIDENFHRIVHMLMALVFTKSVDLVVKPMLIFQGSMSKPTAGIVKHHSLYWPKHGSSEIFTDSDFKLTEEIYQRFEELSTRFSKFSKGRIPSLVRSINFFWQAISTKYYDPAFILYVTSLEALLLTGKAELKHKLAERSALIIRNKSDEKLDIYQKISNAYNIRSTLVHGGSHSLSVERLGSLMYETAKIARECIQVIILDEKLRNIFASGSKKESKIVEDFFKSLICGKKLTEVADEINKTHHLA